MKERLARHLRPEVQDLLRQARQLAGKEPALKRVASLPHDARAMMVRPVDVPGKPYEIHYVKGEERVLDHLIAHEIGHLIRLYQVPEEERLMAAITPESRRRAASSIILELSEIVSQGLPEELLPQTFDLWQQGVCTQLANFPADLRIEAWIHDSFPGLGPVQKRSLIEEVGRNRSLFDPVVVRFTPPTVYRTTMAMNAAQAYHVSELYHLPALMEPFDRNGLGDAGRHLARMVFDAPDQGHRSDMQATDVWAGELGLTGWFEWRALNRIKY